MGSRLNPWVFHTANVALHMASSLLALTVLLRLTGSPIAAFVGAAIFAVHPIQVEAVAWASGTKDLLCGAFSLGSIYCLLRSRHHPSERQWLIAGAAALLLALLSKPTAVVTPLIAIAIDVLTLRTPWRRSIATLWPWLVLVVPFIIIGRLIQPPIVAKLPPLWVRLRDQYRVWNGYAELHLARHEWRDCLEVSRSILDNCEAALTAAERTQLYERLSLCAHNLGDEAAYQSWRQLARSA